MTDNKSCFPPIVIVNDFGYVDGGASAVAINTAIILSSQGYRVSFFCGEGPVSKELINSGVKTICIGSHSINSDPSRFHAAINGIWNARAYRELKHLLQRDEYGNALVHIHTWTKVLTSAVFKASCETGHKTILTVHDYFTICPNGGLYNYQTQSICNLEPMSLGCRKCNCDKRSPAQKQWRVMRQSTQDKWVRNNPLIHYAFVSEFCKDIISPHLKSKFPYRVIRNPITHLDVRDTSSEKDVFLYIGRVAPEKGVDLFCEAVRSIGAKGLVIGAGESLEGLKQQYSDCITFLGWLEIQDMSECGIGHASALIAPSRWYETALLTPLQVLEWGIPCIVPDECAASEYIEDGINGYVFRTGNLKDLIDKMQSILRHPLHPKPISIDDEEYLLSLVDYYGQVDGGE